MSVWGGEFGRTSRQHSGATTGRDHNATGFSMWMAGGGVKGGYRHGATDEHGEKAVDKKMHINDLHATMLYLLGLDHTKLTYQYRWSRRAPDRPGRNRGARYRRLATLDRRPFDGIAPIS